MAPKTTTYRKTFIRQWREKRALRLVDLAERAEVGVGYLSMVERGQRPYNQELLERLADALQTDVASLLIRDPSKEDAIWSIWDHAKPAEREQIVELAKVVTSRKAG